MTAVVPGFLLVTVLVVMIGYVRMAWWGIPRYGPHFPWIAALGATALVALVAALTRGPASPDELLFTRPANAWMESAVLAALVMLPVFGFSARSVRGRWTRNPSGPSATDWASSVFAGIMGLFAVITVVIVLGALVWR